MNRFHAIELDPPQVYRQVFTRDVERKVRVGDKGVWPTRSGRQLLNALLRPAAAARRAVGVFPAHHEENGACWLAPYSSPSFVKGPQLCLTAEFGPRRVRTPRGLKGEGCAVVGYPKNLGLPLALNSIPSPLPPAT